MNQIYKIIIIFSFFNIFFVPASANDFGSDVSLDSLKYFRDSFIKIKTSQGVVIYIDPYIVKDNADSADIVLVTHEHYDHNDLTRINRKASCRVIRSADALLNGAYQSFMIGNIKVTAVSAYNGYHLKSQCVGYVVEFNGIKLYHAGDTGKISEMADLTAQNITYALLPMDGVYTMTPEQATQAAAIIQSTHDIPIHTSPTTDPYDEKIVARFASPNRMLIRPDSTIALYNNPASVEKSSNLLRFFSLKQNFPNPFNPSTVINYEIPISNVVTLKVYDVLGNEVATLVNEMKSAGSYSVQLSMNNYQFTSGIYFYRMKTGNFVETKKLILLK
jgi:L-ascorbate metabolism protein UlaG (beta-lactamase superfamily)